MTREHSLDVAGPGLEPCNVDHVVEPIDQVEGARAVQGAEIAGAEPAATQRVRGLRRTTPVARHHVRPANDDLAGFIDRRGTAVGAHDAGIDAVDRASDTLSTV